MMLSTTRCGSSCRSGSLLLVVGVGQARLRRRDADDFRVAINTLLILFAAFQVFMIGLLADLVGRATRAGHEVQPAAVTAVSARATLPAAPSPRRRPLRWGKRSSA